MRFGKGFNGIKSCHEMEPKGLSPQKQARQEPVDFASFDCYVQVLQLFM